MWWDPGDKGVCVALDPCPCCGRAPVAIGEVYTVQAVDVIAYEGSSGPNLMDSPEYVVLMLAELPHVEGQPCLQWVRSSCLRKRLPAPAVALERVLEDA